MNLKALLAIISLPILLASCIATAGEPDTWSRFRGPNGSGVIESGGLPVHFGPIRTSSGRPIFRLVIPLRC